MEFEAFRMDGLGNDFVIIDQRKRSVSLTKDQIIKICDRNFLGCDQLIFIQNSTISNASMQFYNSDGSTSGACGNGTRCVAYLISEEEKNKNISLNVGNQILNSKILDSKQVETIIGKPKLNWKDIPINRELNTRNLELTISDVDNNKITGGVGINVGNPHVIFFVNDLELFDLKKIGPQIENNEIFPEKCNVTLAQKISNEHIKIKVWERGAGLTKACGTAACATAVAANIDELENTVTEIEFKLGRLQIKIDQDKFIHMKGPVSEIQKITIKL